MASFISAGHHLKDPGAVGNGYQENKLTIEFRDMIVSLCREMGLRVITDNDHERLSEYFNRIKPGSGSVVIDFHFDAAINSTASGSTAFVGCDADRLDKAFAGEMVAATSKVLGIRNRGVKSECESARKRLRIFREAGIICLLEIAFITNRSDMQAYQKNKVALACRLAHIIKKYDDLIL